MPITQQDLDQYAQRTERSVPGQSLTNDPEKPAPYEGPPEFTEKEEALEYFISSFLEDETYTSIMSTLADGIPVMDIVEIVLTNSFREGEINPDLMLILAEPLAYVLLGLAEREGIRAKIVVDPDDDDPDDPDDLDNWDYDDEDDDTGFENTPNPFRHKLQTLKTPKADKELNLDEKIQNVPSLMERKGG